MTSIIDFIEARLAEDEAIAQASIADDQGDDGGLEYEYLTSGRIQRPRFGEPLAKLVTTFAVPRRVLREVEAKRRVMARHCPGMRTRDYVYCRDCPGDQDGFPEVPIDECPELRDIAAVYSDHPDFDPNWSTT